MKTYILAHDLGTTGNKATLYDREGTLIGSAFHAYSTQFEHTGWAEQNPHDWWEAVCVSTRHLLARTGVFGRDVACITFSGQMQGAVPVDAHGQPLRPAIIWMDQRAGTQTDQIAQAIGRDAVYRITGHRLSAAYSLPKIMWMRDHQPQIYADAHKFLTAKDAIIARLTGQFVTEPSDASGMNLFDLAGGVWSESMLQAAALDPSKLPEIRRSVDVAGEVLNAAADEIGIPAGTPVVIGGGDGACASVGAGSIAPGLTYCYVGSSAWIATASTAPLFDPTQRTMTFGHVVPGLFVPMGTMQTAGASYQWMRDQLAPIEAQTASALGVSAFDLMNIVAAGSPPGANGLLFLPYLAGERSPRWNPNARAAFFGLTIRHTRADMLRAVMEGVAYNLSVILGALRGQAGEIDRIRLIGGGASSTFWAQILADVWGVPLVRLRVLEEATSMGAAVIGGIGVGLYPDASIIDQMNPVVETILPNSAHRTLYDEQFALFEATYAALEPVYARYASSKP
ncbi:MAG: xylulokinase [bacterium]|nr:xylulokinase [bacterium]